MLPDMPAAPPNGYPSDWARLQHALELRREGRSYQEIADRVGAASPGKAQALVSRAIRRVLRETAEEVRAVELSRIEALIQCLWDRTIADLDTADPDYRRLDRLKQLIETKLRWCGAQAVIEGQGADNRIQIYVNSYTTPAPKPPAQVTEVKQIEELSDDDKSDVADWVKL